MDVADLRHGGSEGIHQVCCGHCVAAAPVLGADAQKRCDNRVPLCILQHRKQGCLWSLCSSSS